MDKSILVSILVGTVTLAFSYCIYRIQKIRRYPGKLTFTIKDYFRVMRNVPENYQNLSLTYENYQVKENLLYIKFYIFNNQSFDCSCSKDSQPIVIEVPDGVKWIDSKIFKQSSGVETESNVVDDRLLEIHFNLLRDEEFLCVEGLLESSVELNQEELQERIVINHRIPNFDKVKKINILSLSDIKRAKRLVTMPIIYSIILVLAFVATLLFKEHGSPLKYIDNDSGIERLFYINEKNELVYLKSHFPWERYSDPITSEEFLQNYSPVIAYNHDKPDASLFFSYGSIVLFWVLSLVLIIIESSSIIRTKRVEKICNQ